MAGVNRFDVTLGGGHLSEVEAGHVPHGPHVLPLGVAASMSRCAGRVRDNHSGDLVDAGSKKAVVFHGLRFRTLSGYIGAGAMNVASTPPLEPTIIHRGCPWRPETVMRAGNGVGQEEVASSILVLASKLPLYCQPGPRLRELLADVNAGAHAC